MFKLDYFKFWVYVLLGGKQAQLHTAVSQMCYQNVFFMLAYLEHEAFHWVSY